MGHVVIGMDPHKRSATIEIVDGRERVLAQGRYDTDTERYRQMLAAGREFPDRVCAVEGCAGIGRHIARRLVADGETVARGHWRHPPFASAAHFASWNGTAPIDASSGDQKRHPLSRAGNRRINRALDIMAVVQLRHDTPAGPTTSGV